MATELTRLLGLAQELQTVYQTYPTLRAMVGAEAWQGLTDVAYGQLLELNLAPSNAELRQRIELNLTRLEDLSASSLVRTSTGLRDTLSRVLIYRISNRLAKKDYAADHANPTANRAPSTNPEESR